MTRHTASACGTAILGWGLACAILSNTSLAIDLAKDTALRLAPDDADIFVGGMQFQEQWKRFTASQLYRDVSNVPLVEKAVGSFREQWENREGQVGKIRQAIENPNFESLLKLAQDMFSEEAFILFDGKASEMVIAINELSAEIEAEFQSGDPDAIIDFLLQLPKAEIDDIPIATMVAGFKVRDQERVLGKLDELEGILRFGLGNVPSMQSFVEGLERFEDERGVRLTWTIIPEMIPWAQFRQGLPVPDAEELTNKIQELLAERQVCITVGQLDGYLIFAVSEEPKAILELGSQPNLLTNPDLKPVLDRANETITAVSYVSDAYADAYFHSQLKGFFFRQFSGYARLLKTTMGGDYPAEFESLPDDLAWIDEQIEGHVPDFLGQTSVSFLTKSGSEVWSYARTENVVFDASEPLDILQHVGGDPMAMLAFRLQDRPEFFATARRIVRKVKEYLDVLPELSTLSESERDAWRVGLERGWPLFVKLADTWEKQFLPAMRDGQHAWTLRGGNLKNQQWFKEMPPSKSPLPIPDASIITGVSDRDGMIDAFRSLFDLFDEGLDLAREYESDAIPVGFSIPRPGRIDSANGDKFIMPIPIECPVPKELLPQVLLTDRFMMSSYSDDQTSAVSNSQPMTIAKEVIQPNRACSGVAYLDLGRLIKFFKPWIAYAIDSSSQGDTDRELIEGQSGLPSVKGSDLLDLWTALGSAGQLASVTTQNDDGISVTRTVFTQP